MNNAGVPVGARRLGYSLPELSKRLYRRKDLSALTLSRENWSTVPPVRIVRAVTASSARQRDNVPWFALHRLPPPETLLLHAPESHNELESSRAPQRQLQTKPFDR